MLVEDVERKVVKDASLLLALRAKRTFVLGASKTMKWRFLLASCARRINADFASWSAMTSFATKPSAKIAGPIWPVV